MPTRHPRLQITLDPEVADIIRTIAAASKQSRAKVAADVITEAAPVLRRIAVTLENVRRLNEQKADAIRRTIEGAQAEAEQVAATALALLERISDEAAEGTHQWADAPQARRPKVRPAARRKAPPPHC
jgi:ABC-type transporter Mla subunit MlaD